MKKFLFSTDVDLLESNFIVNDADTNTECNAFYLVPVNNGEDFQVYCFDLLNTLDDWFDLHEIYEFTGFDYTAVPEKDRDLQYWANLTNDVCQYYGALNFGAPTLVKADNLEAYIKS